MQQTAEVHAGPRLCHPLFKLLAGRGLALGRVRCHCRRASFTRVVGYPGRIVTAAFDGVVAAATCRRYTPPSPSESSHLWLSLGSELAKQGRPLWLSSWTIVQAQLRRQDLQPVAVSSYLMLGTVTRKLKGKKVLKTWKVNLLTAAAAFLYQR